MAYMGLYRIWSWDCAEFDEIVILERVFFDYGEGPMVARIHCSGRPRRRDVEVPPGTRRWASLLETLREVFNFAGNLNHIERQNVRILIDFMTNSRKCRE